MPADPEHARTLERALAVHRLAEVVSVILLHLPLLREEVATLEGRELLDVIERACGRCPALFEALRKVI